MNFLRSLILVTALFAPLTFAANKPAAQPVNLKDATLAVYHGKQVCKYTTHETGFGPMAEWGCKFESQFTCSATVIGDRDHKRRYTGLTAGHCFDWEKESEYYISSQISQTPVLNKIKLIKFEYDSRYDFAIFEFEPLRDYPVVPIGMDFPEVGAVVTNVNFALGLAKQQTEGKVVSGLITTPAMKQLDDTKGRFLVSIGIGPGASGSAVVADGKIVGIVEAIFPETQMPTVVIPTGQTLLNFMDDDSAGIKPKLEPKKVASPTLPDEDEKANVFITILRILYFLI